MLLTHKNEAMIAWPGCQWHSIKGVATKTPNRYRGQELLFLGEKKRRTKVEVKRSRSRKAATKEQKSRSGFPPACRDCKIVRGMLMRRILTQYKSEERTQSA
uniref:Uncharacterized protein n=1 Tax=Pristionchus pacificus TaxID=54126 RepID=A0A2A6BMC1_PRIPA|eukprot:PDM67057.1 hypothetical protein PRIPAC_48474 [Pristionchus pacificus]